MRVMKHVLIAAAIGLVLGCSTRPDFVTGFDQARPSHLYGFVRHADATVVVSNIMPSAEPGCMARLSIDKRIAADLAPGETAYLHVTFGAHRLEVMPSVECLGVQSDAIRLDLKAGDALVVNLRYRVGGAVELVRLD